MTRKIAIELCITFFIALVIYVLADFNFIYINEWDKDKIVNFLHTWITLFSAYLLYNYLLKVAFKKWKLAQLQQWIFLLFGVSIIILFFVIITELLFYKYYYQVDSLLEETTFFDFDFPITLVLLILGSLFFYQKYYFKTIGSTPSVEVIRSEKIKVNKGKGRVFISPETIGLFYIENNVVWVQTLDGEKYHTDYSLSSLLNKLDVRQFFRLNRQSIVSRAAIKGFEKLPFQKLKVELIETINSDAFIVSKYNAPSFKKWLTNSSD